MKLRILGCSGGIGGDLRTTSMLLDHDTLIDAGTGVGDLSVNELAQIDHIFVTHSHMDHVTSIPFIADTVGWLRDRPISVHATSETISILKEHLFNWRLWPDFTQIPDAHHPVLRYVPLALGDPVALNGRPSTAGASRRCPQITSSPPSDIISIRAARASCSPGIRPRTMRYGRK